MKRVVIVGASAGGLAVAEALRRAGHDGSITLIGDEPHLPYDRPPLSKQILTGQWQQDRLPLRPRADIDALQLDLRLGVAAIGLDPAGRTVLLAGGVRQPYDGLVVATGVRARHLPGSEGVTGVHTLRTLEDAVKLRSRLRPGRRLVIVGAGFIGAEVAAVARGLGVDVTLLEAGPEPLTRAVGEDAGRFLAQLHRDRGVRLRTLASVAEIVVAGSDVTGVRLTDDTVEPADDVLVAIGSVPNTDWLDGSGLKVSNGLVCDEFSAAAPGVYGVGDVARWHNPRFGTTMRVEHRSNAAEQGMAVAHNLLNPGAQRPFAPVPYFWSDQYDRKVQSYGHLHGHEQALVLRQDPHHWLVSYRKGDRLTGVLGIGVPPKELRTWRALVAARTPWDEAITATDTVAA
ncbi:NAD(P)/FAD-dependent oxidoreductase [Streptomyces olindensis]|uniref:NAD(P)/FAD-dependent oxidoreductase n=1 Tax=Streptomyces olindensis TaxID=358823 RepID=UPI0036CB4734